MRSANSRVVERVDGNGRIDMGRCVERAQSEAVRRAALLRGRDRVIIEMALRGSTVRAIGDAVGLPPATVHRRVRRIGERLHHPVVGLLMEAGCAVAGEYRQIGLEFFLIGLSEREVADKHRMSRGSVRKVVQYLRGWGKGAAGGAGVAD